MAVNTQNEKTTTCQYYVWKKGTENEGYRVSYKENLPELMQSKIDAEEFAEFNRQNIENREVFHQFVLRANTLGYGIYQLTEL